MIIAELWNNKILLLVYGRVNGQNSSKPTCPTKIYLPKVDIFLNSRRKHVGTHQRCLGEAVLMSNRKHMFSWRKKKIKKNILLSGYFFLASYEVIF